MKFKFTGDFSSLERFKKKIEKTPSALVTVSEQLAEETLELIREGFEESRDPYGSPWESLVLREGKPLEDTGAMKASWHRQRADARGFSVANSKPYAKYHQDGTGIYGPRGTPIVPIKAKVLRLGKTGRVARSVKGSPPRRMVPTRNRLPAAWKARYVETANEVLTELFR